MAASSGGDDLDLTSFLDLFATLICFLLLTAAWVQIEALSTNVENTTSSDSPPPPDQEKKVQLVMTIMQNEIQMAEDEQIYKVPVQISDKGTLNVDLIKSKLAEWRAKYPERKDVVLNTENEVPYKHLITTFDTLVGEGWPDVGVNTQ